MGISVVRQVLSVVQGSRTMLNVQPCLLQCRPSKRGLAHVCKFQKVLEISRVLVLMRPVCTFQILDIKSTRIDDVLKEISETMLCDLPEKKPWTLDEFVSKTKVRQQSKIKTARGPWTMAVCLITALGMLGATITELSTSSLNLSFKATQYQI